MDKPWKVICAFVGVFIAGAVFGGFFTLRSSSRRLSEELAPARQAVVTTPVAPPAVAPSVGPVPVAQPPPAEIVPPGARGPSVVPLKNQISIQLMRQFTQRLVLTNAQREKIRPIFARWGEDFQHLRQENERQLQLNLTETLRLSERMYREVGDLLTPDQRAELEKMRRETQERAERERQKRLDAAAASKALKGPGPGDPSRPVLRPDKAKNAGP